MQQQLEAPRTDFFSELVTQQITGVGTILGLSNIEDEVRWGTKHAALNNYRFEAVRRSDGKVELHAYFDIAIEYVNGERCIRYTTGGQGAAEMPDGVCANWARLAKPLKAMCDQVGDLKWRTSIVRRGETGDEFCRRFHYSPNDEQLVDCTESVTDAPIPNSHSSRANASIGLSGETRGSQSLPD